MTGPDRGDAVRNGDLYRALEVLDEIAGTDVEVGTKVTLISRRFLSGDRLLDLVGTDRGVEIPLLFRVLRAA